ncbi:MAG: pentapeptide repeat-containing protein [Myxococcaceae bacterium]
MKTSTSLIAALIVLSTPAFAQFSFDPAVGACVNAAGERGVNAGTGACGDYRSRDLAGADFASTDLRGARFDGATLRNANFKGASLEGASFQGADLTGAVLTGARLDRALFSQARLVGAHLEYATLTGASLSNADVRNACLYRASFQGADLRAAQFSRTRSLVSNARWSQAVVLSDTLPFDAAELAREQLDVRPAELIVAR